MVTISAPTQALLGPDAVAHCWTANSDGSPQVSVVWVIAREDERHLVIRGTASIEPGPNPQLLDELAKKYLDLSRHPLAMRDSPSAVVVRVRIDRISGAGPWIDDS